MSDIAHEGLTKLYARAEGGAIRRSAKAATLVFNENGFPQYLALRSFEAKEAAHGIFAAAERAGAIRIEWDELAGQRGHIIRLRVTSVDALARFLGVTPYCQHLAKATVLLEPYRSLVPEVHRFLDRWKAGKPLRGAAASNVLTVVDAAMTLHYLRTEEPRDRSLRALSVKLFGDSKRLEALDAILDALTSNDPTRARHRDEIFESLGLFRAVMPMLITGPAEILSSAGIAIPLVSPYLGLAADSVAGLVRESARDIPYVLTIENFTPFNELARGAAGPVQGIIVYTGGMPSPAWRNAYIRLITSTPAAANILHWGDVDVGGFRIAERIASELSSLGRTLQPHLMNPADLVNLTSSSRAVQHDVIREMRRSANRLGWSGVADAFDAYPICIEQEAIEPFLPNVTGNRACESPHRL